MFGCPIPQAPNSQCLHDLLLLRWSTDQFLEGVYEGKLEIHQSTQFQVSGLLSDFSKIPRVLSEHI